MQLTDEAVPEPADLSSGRRLVKERNGETVDENPAIPTRSVLEVRGILCPSRCSPTVAETGGNPAPTLTSAAALHQRVAEAEKPRVVWIPVVPMSREGFEVLQKFEGTVLSVTGDAFVARLVDRTHAGPEEEAEIPLGEIMPGDRELVQPGAVFYWVIGYRREAHGQLSRSSVIRFQRIPSWSPTEVERAKEAADTFLSFLDLDRANRPA